MPCRLWVSKKPRASQAWGPAVHALTHHLSPSWSVVDYSMFENLNTALTPRLQSSRSVPHLCRPADALGSVESSGPSLWVGSSQHLKNLGRAVGAKVNDFLRRREPWSLGSVGAMAVNRTAEAQLADGADGEDER